MYQLLSAAVLLRYFVIGTHAYGMGAPNSDGICTNMLPGHGAEAKTTPSPYRVHVSNYDLIGQQKTSITLTAPEGQFFKGFLAIVKKLREPESAVGEFSSNSPDVKLIDCLNSNRSAVTHTSASEKKSVTFDWNGPSDRDYDNLELVVTFVREGNEIWQAIPHPKIISTKLKGFSFVRYMPQVLLI